MSRKMISNSNLKPVCSVADMVKLLGMSRARFYQLQEQGIFPPPIYDIRTRRPIYTLELQQACLTVRESNIGYQGQYVLFYAPRKEKSAEANGSKKLASSDSPIHEITKTLQQMKLSVTVAQVKSAIEELFPDGIEDKEQGIIIRDLFRFFKKGA